MFEARIIVYAGLRCLIRLLCLYLPASIEWKSRHASLDLSAAVTDR